MQPVDYTTLMASQVELNRDWIPSRLEQVYQRDRFTICLGLRTLKAKPWLTICWHPEAAPCLSCAGADCCREQFA